MSTIDPLAPLATTFSAIWAAVGPGVGLFVTGRQSIVSMSHMNVFV